MCWQGDRNIVRKKHSGDFQWWQYRSVLFASMRRNFRETLGLCNVSTELKLCSWLNGLLWKKKINLPALFTQHDGSKVWLGIRGPSEELLIKWWVWNVTVLSEACRIKNVSNDRVQTGDGCCEILAWNYTGSKQIKIPKHTNFEWCILNSIMSTCKQAGVLFAIKLKIICSF